MGCVMCADKPQFGVRLGLRLLVATAAAAVLTGCSDATRLSSNPFSNPFETASSGPVDRMPTGTIAPRAPSSSTRIEARPLAPPSGTGALPAPVTTPQPIAPKPLSAAPTRSLDHWSAEGGTPIVVAQGESVRTLSERYGVPQDAMLRVNGFSSAAQVQPGARLVVPVYRATAAAAPAPVAAAKPAPVKTFAAAPAPKAEAPKEKFRLVKGPEPVAHKTAKVEKREDAAEKAALAKRAEARKAEEKKAEAKKAEEKKIADRKAAEHKAAERKAEKARKAAEAAKTEAKPSRQKHAALEAATPAPEARQAEARKPAVSHENTASIPKQELKPASGDANPEFRWPARGRIIQGFKSGGNDGINISVPEGTAVKAAEGGVVKYAGSELKGYGKLVLIQHPNGFVSAYAHNGELDVKRGDTVKRGQTIAKAGQTGNVSSPQVHFELRKGSTPVDPTGYLAGL